MSANNPHFLLHRRLVITRPTQQAQALIQMIQQAGGSCIEFPLLEILPLQDMRQFDALLAQLGQLDMALFISANAVEQAMRRCQALHIDFPTDLPCVAVGPSTAQALRAYGVTQVLMPEQQFDSEGVLQMPQLQDMHGKRVLLVKGEGGRDVLASGLAQRGAEVMAGICYRRAAPQQDTFILDEAWQQGGFDGILLTSSEAMRHLLDLAQQRPWLRQCKIFVNHPRVAEQARHLHGLQLIIAPSTDDAGMWAALQQEFQRASAGLN